MAKTRSLPDKFYDKDYEHNGIHRVPLWRIAGYALNNTATNVYLMMMNYATYYLMGWVGVGMMVASSLTMMMRIWDGVTDPFVGFMVDKTNGKFGKNRPFIVIGQIHPVRHQLGRIPCDPQAASGRALPLLCGRSDGLLPGLHLPVCCYQVCTELHDQ